MAIAKKNTKATASAKTTTKPQSSPSSKSTTKPASTPTVKAKAKPEPTGFDYSELKVAENQGKKLGMTFDPQGSFVTVSGTAAWAWINKPDEGDGDKGPKYKITLVTDPDDPEMEEFHNRCLEFQNAYFEAIGEEATDTLTIIKDGDEKADKFEEMGITPGPLIVAKANATGKDGEIHPMTIYNSDAEDVTGEATIWTGDKVRLEISLAGYNSPTKSIGHGIAVYLRAVQLIEEGPRTGGGSKAGSKFTAVGGAKKTNKFNKQKSTNAEAEDETNDNNDDIPF